MDNLIHASFARLDFTHCNAAGAYLYDEATEDLIGAVESVSESGADSQATLIIPALLGTQTVAVPVRYLRLKLTEDGGIYAVSKLSDNELRYMAEKSVA
ncbi:MAG: hypothetical protein DI533_16930 [Cereibacter sphaeroides]|uniref:PRC-barrel domain-containing protein n=1 Tax=Cereibacter sphaeroides TaxID=1063 RepID=A0A2W5SAF3_CERSP|nr:MAG: hypothetical protein DI533_16930 [Cereibacter sphaeroides]